jgi:protein-tyrosine phosphatase
VNGVYWIYADAGLPLAPALKPPATRGPIPLAVVLCPPGGSHLRRELAELRRAGIQTLVSLLSEEQIAMLDLADEGAEARRLGMQFLSHPIPDHNLPPDPQAFREFVCDLARRLQTGERIGIHCWGSIGRATVTAACTLIHLGWAPAIALAAVEEARGCPVPDTEEQEQWILNYKAHP